MQSQLPLIETLKQIASFVARHTRRDITIDQVRRWARRATDPLPLDYFAGGAAADSGELQLWIERQRGRRRPPVATTPERRAA